MSRRKSPEGWVEMTDKKQGKVSARKRVRESRWKEPKATMALSTRGTWRSFLHLMRKELRVRRKLRVCRARRVRSRGIAQKRKTPPPSRLGYPASQETSSNQAMMVSYR